MRVDVRLVTWSGAMPGGDGDSAHLLQPLRDTGATVDIRAWDDGSVDWADAAVTVIRSTWDYHERPAAFLDWVEHADRVTLLENRAPLIRWNSHKSYLIDLEHAGLPIVPTAVLRRGEPADTAKLAPARGWPEIVLKPAVSLDGHDVIRTPNRPADADPVLEPLLLRGDVIIQPFVSDVIRDGELSLVFVDGCFQHAVRKRPAPGEFRVQERLGGTTTPAMAPAAALRLGTRTIESLPAQPLYARVDLVSIGDAFHVTELELVEPSLFLAHSPRTARRFAHAIARRLDQIARP